MATLETFALPLLPLSTGVVLPGMVVTLALESPEALAAVAAAQNADGRLVLVPKLGGGAGPDGGQGSAGSTRYARVGTVAQIDGTGNLPGGVPAVAVRGMHRAVIGSGVPGTGEALWVSLERAEETPPTARAEELAREYRLVVRFRGERLPGCQVAVSPPTQRWTPGWRVALGEAGDHPSTVRLA